MTLNENSFQTLREGTSAQEHEACDKPFWSFARVANLFLLGVVSGLVIYFLVRGDLTQDKLKDWLAALPTYFFLPAFFLLPLVGSPIGVLLLASGMKYGLGASLGIAVVGMAFHTFAIWHLAHGLFRRRVASWLKRTRFEMPHIPEHHQVWFTSVFVTVPGIPYTVKVYSLALTNLPFRRYFFIVWIVHVLNAIPLIGIGFALTNLNLIWLSIIGLLSLLAVFGAKWLLRRLGNRMVESESPQKQSANGEPGLSS